MNDKAQLRKRADVLHQVVTALVLRHGTTELTSIELGKAKARSKRVNVKSNGKGGVVLELLGEQPAPQEREQ